MKKKLLLAFFIFASFIQIDAQAPARTYVITSDTATLQFLDNNFWITIIGRYLTIKTAATLN